MINNWHKINKKWKQDRRLELLEKTASYAVLIALVVNILAFVGITRQQANRALKTPHIDTTGGTMYLSCSEHLKNKELKCI
jgi:hypothetical protein|tara:strand:- start:1106 stop:1348 length:243 start_codon:yes stop_codon:yes gene_type:complete